MNQRNNHLIIHTCGTVITSKSLVNVLGSLSGSEMRHCELDSV